MSFPLTLLLAAGVVLVALLSNRLSARVRIPAPAFFLLAAAAASDAFPALYGLSLDVVEQIVTVALVLILFDGGIRIGARRLRAALTPVLSTGVLGTFVTAGAVAVLAHWLFGFGWSTSLLLGTALAPTDPAVVFSVLGSRRIGGRTGTIVEGESGANDPVGIALLVALLAATGQSGWSAGGAVALEFGLQMVIGTAVGVAGALLLRLMTRRLALPGAGLYPVATLAFAVGLYGATTLAHGSGFLAVFVAGIGIGDVPTPFKREIEGFHDALASLAEIIAFVVLGLTVSLTTVISSGAWLIGLALAGLLIVVVRPLAIGPLLLLVRLRAGERAFVLWSGLKGAVPVLLATYVLAADPTHDRLPYEIVFVVVAVSVVVQGGLVPTVARWCAVPMHTVPLRPWVLGVRLQDRPEDAQRLEVAAASDADGRTVRDLHREHAVWVSLVVRDGRTVRLAPTTTLRAGDEVLVLGDPGSSTELESVFARPVTG